MILSFIKRDRIQNYSLPKEMTTTSYWIKDENGINKKPTLIQLDSINKKWVLKSNSDVKIIFNNTYVNEIEVKEYDFIYLKSFLTDEIIMVYCCPEYDNSFKQFVINRNANISIGSTQDNNIVFLSNLVAQKHAILTYNNGVYQIRATNPNCRIYVNNFYTTGANLQIGDVVFIMGLKIIIAGSFIVINNPNNRVAIDNGLLMPRSFTRKDVEVKDEDIEMNLYENDDYFRRAPRFISTITESIFEIDPPPEPQKSDEKPFIYVIGPMLTMGLTSVMFAYQAINGVMTEGRELSSAMPSIVMSFAMLSSMLMWPLLNRRYEKKKKKEDNELLVRKYTEYIDKNDKEIESEMSNQKVILLQNHIPLEDCQKIVLSKSEKLWERRINDDDFLLLRLGTGTLESKVQIQTQKKGFTLEENNLRDLVDKLVTKSKNMENVPICLPFTQNFVSAISGDNKVAKQFIDGLILRMVTFHSYSDLKIVFFTDEKNKEKYSYLKTIPHCFGDNNQIRFFATNIDEIQQVSNYLDEVYNQRKNAKEEGAIKSDDNDESKLYKEFSPYYVIIVDDLANSRNSRIVKKVLSDKINYGFSIIFRTDKLSNLPNECTTFMNVFEKESGLFENELVANKQKIFQADFIGNINMNNIAVSLSNTPIEVAKGVGSMPDAIGFLEMYNVGKVEQLNVQERWKNNNPAITLQAPVGIDEVGEIFKIDIHEKYHGPHGLIAGMTGSGKSEFIITYILSLAVQYHPNDVSFVLIDYKGGGLSGAFENKETGIRLPHLAGSITNLDTAEMNRALSSIQSELRRRQAMFNKVRDRLNESTMDIYKYQSLYRQGVIKEPISHLLIISDEFAELKSQQPDFMDQLISTARIGRSLGVHLILATQKPAGVVNDQIWSNSRFRVCLKVQEKADSMDVIKCADAASLKNVGRFYLQVGYNELFALGQAAWCGMQYTPQDTYKKKVDTSINFIDNVGNIIKSVDGRKKIVTTSYGEELPNIVTYLSNVAKQNNISIRKLWLDKIPAIITVDELRRKYSVNSSYLNLNPIIGELDDPMNQRQDVLTLPLSEKGNTLIYGIAGSGKEMMLNSIIYSTITNHGVDEVNIYIMDFGAETLKSFSKAPHIGDVILVNEQEKIINLIKQLYEVIENRKKLFADYNGDYKQYCRRSGKVLPTILVIINAYEVFQETYDKYTEDIIKLTREANRYGIIFILTTNAQNSIRYTLSQNFGQIIALRFNDAGDYSSLFGPTKGMMPSGEKGRGLVKLDELYEFQTASLTKDGDESEFIENICKTLASNPTQVFAAKIPVLPEKVTLDNVASAIKDLKAIPIGIDKASLKINSFDFKSKLVSVVTGDYNESFLKFVPGLISELLTLTDYQLITIDALDIIDSSSFIKGTFVKDDFGKMFDMLLNHVKNNRDPKYKPVICIIVGVSSFIEKLPMETKSKFEELLKTSKEANNINYIFVDSVGEYKKQAYNTWFTANIDKKSYIWIGTGISNQFTFEMTKMIREDANSMNDTFGYVVKNGVPQLTKVIEYVDTEFVDE